MSSDQNPHESPRSSQVTDEIRRDRSLLRTRLIEGIRCAVFGVVCGGVWTALFGAAEDGPASIPLAAVVYVSGFAITGFVVGFTRRFASGPWTGVIVLATWAFAVGPKDPWVVLWLFMFGGSGLLWGFVIASFWRRFLNEQEPLPP